MSTNVEMLALFGNYVHNFMSEKISTDEAIKRGLLILASGTALCIFIPRSILSIFIILVLVFIVIVAICTNIYNSNLKLKRENSDPSSQLKPNIIELIKKQRENLNNQK